MKKRNLVLFLALTIILLSMASCNASKNKYEVTKIGDIEIANDIFSFQMAIDGKLYTLPAQSSDFSANGWNLMNADAKLAPMSSTMDFMTKNNKILMVSFFDDTDSEKKLSDCAVNKITVQPMTGIELILPHGLSFDYDLTLEKLIEFYGEPDSVSEQERFMIIKYIKDSDSEIMFTLFSSDSDEFDKSMVTFKVKGL